MSHGLDCDGDGPGENEMGEASERKDRKEFGFKYSSIRKKSIMIPRA